ncbi:hypothetical protein [Pseudomonas sp.]|uniref:hypothetical protein n=1 Tax=Pseudomonas sp. TaxID=306 RepID=UPI0031D39480
MKGMLLLLLCAATIIGLPILIYLAVRADYRASKQMKIDLKRDFQSVLEEFQIGSYKVLVERTSHGHSTRVSEVYRIFHDDKGQYYFYQYISGHPGIVKLLSRERALLAAGAKEEAKV